MLRPQFAGAVVASLAVALLSTSAPADSQLSGMSSRRNLGATDSAQPDLRSVPHRTVTLAAAGDIACRPPFTVTRRQCQQAATATLIRRRDPDQVLALGDTQYRRARWRDYQASYDRSWGTFLRRTLPVTGNHEYLTPHARGYFRYFGARAHGPRGWYAVDRGRWRIYVLNTNCAAVSCSRERRWLARDLQTHPRRCSLAASHQPRFASGLDEPSPMKRFWPTLDRHQVDLALAGHEHVYERFAPMHVDGTIAHSGIRSFAVGTGGRGRGPLTGGGSHKELVGDRGHGSRFWYAQGFGVLFLTLRPDKYAWSFRTIEGTVIDRGTSTCRR